MVSSPLRYPGGKAKLFPFFAELIRENKLFGSHYCEPFAGGAGLAIKLLTHGYVDSIAINDIDTSIYAFWLSALNHTDEFCRLVSDTPITIDEWHHQKSIWENGDAENEISLGFAAFFLNRTNRSGIIEGAGPIGGYAQEGEWKIDVRLNKAAQIKNLKMLSRFAPQIRVSNLDALEFFRQSIKDKYSLTYLDPPYYVKGHKLYKNFYNHDDHIQIAKELARNRQAKWVVSYDDVIEIREAYREFSPISYSLNYSAGEKSRGSEVIYLSDVIDIPCVAGFRMVS